MRVLSIRGENLASLADTFEVNFEDGPLGTTGLFAITGPTGSGKSTLLDAICLALFDELPRMGSADKSGEIGRGDIDGGERIKYSDVRSILRHGAGSGFAEIDFVGQDGRSYRSRWEVKRARGKASGKLQNQKITFSDIEANEVIGDKKRDTLGEIQKRVGLDFNQFKRAALLAQGDFDTFIKSDSRERATLLERITGTEIYAEISAAAYKRSKSVQDELDLLRARLGEHVPLSPDARSEAEGVAQKYKHETSNFTRRREQIKKHGEWYSTKKKLEASIAKAKTQHSHAIQVNNEAADARSYFAVCQVAYGLRAEYEAEITSSQKVDHAVEALNKAVKAREEADTKCADLTEVEKTAIAEATVAKEAWDTIGPELDKASKLDTQIERAETDVQGSISEHELAKKSLEELVNSECEKAKELDVSTSQLNENEAWLRTHESHKLMSGDFETTETDIRNFAKITAEINQLETDVKTHDAAVQDANILKDEETAQLDILKLNRDNTQAEIDAILEKSGVSNGDLLSDQLSIAKELQSLTRDGERESKGVCDALNEVKRLTESKDAQQQVLSDCVTAQATIDLETPAAEARLEEAQRSMNLSQASIDEATVYLRDLLEPGDNCPVCGSLEHPMATGDNPLSVRVETDRARVKEITNQLNELTAQKERALATEQNAKSEITRIDAQCITFNKKEKAARLGWESVLSRASGLITKAGIALVELPSDPSEEDVKTIITALSKSVDDRISDLGIMVNDLRKHQAKNKEIEGNLQEIGDNISKLERLQLKNQGEAKSVRSSLSEKNSAQKAIKQRLKRILGALYPKWPDAVNEDENRFISECRKAAEEWKSRSSEQGGLSTHISELKVSLAELSTNKKSAEANFIKSQKQFERATASLEGLKVARSKFIDGRPVSDVRTEHKTKATETEQLKQEASKRRTKAAEKMSAARAHQKAANQTLDSAKTTHRESEATLRSRLDELNLSKETVLEVLAKGDTWLEDERTRLDEIKERVSTTKATLIERERLLTEHVATDKPTEGEGEVKKLLEETEALLQTSQNELANAQAVITRDDIAKAKSVTIKDELASAEGNATTWGRLNDIIGSHDGAKFRRFAQSLTLTHLVDLANGHLKDLAPRYELERAPGGDLVLQVIDHHMGDEVRGIHNLSGGERFLASLALALGLASMSSSQGIRVDSLFIDEGFGSLDNTSLAMAVSALESLQSTGRKVGVISHVDELKERIGIQVQVVPQGGGRSEIVVR